MPDITGWSEDEIEAWEDKHQQFATEERANAAADKWSDEHKAEIEESRFWARYYAREDEDEDEARNTTDRR